MKKSVLIFSIVFSFFLISCSSKKNREEKNVVNEKGKKVVYQVFTRLFGNTNTTNKPWGTKEDNGVGKFNDFTEKALSEIKELGVTHIWYTGVLHHAMAVDYTEFGISNDDPDVIKGRAGSPYAVKDYYNVDPDLAIHPDKRLQEFKALIDRSHKVGLKVVIDIIPNHVARHYKGANNPNGIVDFGAEDDTTKVYHVNNNFYYNPGKPFKVPQNENNYKVLGGESHPLADGVFIEKPSKWTGNGSRLAQPDFNDWYETIKINYGIRPDGTRDFDSLPANYENENYKKHFEFWKNKTVPNSWEKFKNITDFWLTMGVDGFRYDMAEMVPVEFWSYLNSFVKSKNENAFLLAEVYNPSLYKDYIHKGKMDYLYDKVQMYDTLKNIMQGKGSTDNINPILEDLSAIEHNMIHFLENHDEQRIASPEFAGSAEKGKPAMVVSATITTAPTLIYFGQEVGEPGAENAGFGQPSRTSIFDYVGVPHFQRWVNNKKFDGGQSTLKEKKLRDFYKRLLNFTISSTALMGDYMDLHAYNRMSAKSYTDELYCFSRWNEEEKLIIISNFSSKNNYHLPLKIPSNLIKYWKLKDGVYTMTDQLYGKEKITFTVKEGKVELERPISIAPLESYIFKQ
ncbi:alpha-amylase family protein [uncultured Maribacter sp.]|uniref:alpha-amylase family protein n=1 Tax=uncultured Maribacter sp. TaxID=431308 RepID=UPI00261B4F6B|nr:alpha-amylase family protein [uncultured Maribacter sp.]